MRPGQPLEGRTIVVTRAAAQARSFADLLRADGARVIEAPTTIRIQSIHVYDDLSVPNRSFRAGCLIGAVPTLDDSLDALARRALDLVREDTVVGLGAGRAAAAFVRALGARVRQGWRVQGVPVSDDTARLARQLGIPLVGLEGELDVTVDGADEVDPDLNLIKGYGGALVRERIVAAASRRQIILATPEKLVPRLGSHGRLPVEVMSFAIPLCRRRLEALGLKPELRTQEQRPFVTDNGNVILDCAVDPIPNAPALERAIREVPGVVDTGLFLGTADMVLVLEAGAVRALTRRRQP